jgi:hypothetical protein
LASVSLTFTRLAFLKYQPNNYSGLTTLDFHWHYQNVKNLFDKFLCWIVNLQSNTVLLDIWSWHAMDVHFCNARLRYNRIKYMLEFLGPSICLGRIYQTPIMSCVLVLLGLYLHHCWYSILVSLESQKFENKFGIPFNLI